MKTAKVFLGTLFLLTMVASCNKKKYPGKDFPPGSEPKVERIMSTSGKLMGSSYVSRDGKTIKMAIVGGSSSNGRNNEIVFTKNNEVILRINTTVEKNGDGIGKYSLAVHGHGVNYLEVMDASSIVLEEGKDSEGIAPIEISSGEKSWNGNLDFSTSKFSNLENAVSLQHEIPNAISFLIDPLINDAVNFYSGPGGIGIQVLTMGQPVILASVKGNLCRAACWAGGSAVIAACCVGTGGWGCIVCAAIWAADASLCADLCPK